MRGERLREQREKRGLSQIDLAERVGVSDQQIYRYETGRSEPTSGVLARIAHELEISTDYLTGLVDEPTAHAREEDLSPDERELLAAFRRGDLRKIMRLVADSDSNESRE